MYSLVPAIVSIMIFWVLNPKSANLINGRGFPITYFDFSRIFYGFRSRWVILWLCSYCTPLLICSIHSNAYRSPILLSLHKLRASLTKANLTTAILPNSTMWYTTLPPAAKLYRISLGCFRCLLSSALSWCAFPCLCLQGQPMIFSLCEWQWSLWIRYQTLDTPESTGKYLCEVALTNELCFVEVELFFKMTRFNLHNYYTPVYANSVPSFSQDICARKR